MEPAGLWNFQHQPPTVGMNSYSQGAGSHLANLPPQEFPEYGRYGRAGLFLNRQGKVLFSSTVKKSNNRFLTNLYTDDRHIVNTSFFGVKSKYNDDSFLHPKI